MRRSVRASRRITRGREAPRSAAKLGPVWAANHLADRVGALTRGWAQDEALAAAMAERIVDLLGP